MLLKPFDTTVTHQKDPKSTDVVTEGEAKKRISDSLRVAHRASLAGNCSLDHFFCIISLCILNKVVHLSLTSMALCSLSI